MRMLIATLCGMVLLAFVPIDVWVAGYPLAYGDGGNGAISPKYSFQADRPKYDFKFDPKAYAVQGLVLPPGKGHEDFAACVGARAFVPHEGGIMAAGLNKWVVEPSGEPITSVACDEVGDLFFMRGGELHIRNAKDELRKVKVPKGDWKVIATVDPTVWLYGQLSDGRGAILQVHPKSGISVLYANTKPVRVAAVIGTTGLVAVIDRSLITWRGAAQENFGELGEQIDGLAVAANGALFVSGPKGISRLATLKSRPEQVAVGVHGPLRLRGDVLYVLSRETRTVLRFTPRAALQKTPNR